MKRVPEDLILIKATRAPFARNAAEVAAPFHAKFFAMHPNVRPCSPRTCRTRAAN